MKKVIMLAAVVAALASCQSKANKTAEAEADSLAIAMSCFGPDLQHQGKSYPVYT